jgi:hypothetical protein
MDFTDREWDALIAEVKRQVQAGAVTGRAVRTLVETLHHEGVLAEGLRGELAAHVLDAAFERVATSLGMSHDVRAIYDRVSPRDSDWVTGSLTAAFADAAKAAVGIETVGSPKFIDDEPSGDEQGE